MLVPPNNKNSLKDFERTQSPSWTLWSWARFAVLCMPIGACRLLALETVLPVTSFLFSNALAHGVSTAFSDGGKLSVSPTRCILPCKFPVKVLFILPAVALLILSNVGEALAPKAVMSPCVRDASRHWMNHCHKAQISYLSLKLLMK